ncbi:tyrosine-type recombinase/integrase [Streptomyces mexicanus]|uniref:tyrosine-type recombinase/integrase n=1 Tax=Streptomyces mexicanus TaxID=178566 RepID=UPI0036895BC2
MTGTRRGGQTACPFSSSDKSAPSAVSWRPAPCSTCSAGPARRSERNKAFTGLTFTPHDFRRLFATEIVDGGLPIRIGAALLGHLILQTTQGYVAAFNEDVVAHYQQFLNNRRSLRSAIDYGEVTKQEWAEFEEHFEKRKVELGNCARPYGTPCQHEHACIRCPVLQVNPKNPAAQAGRTRRMAGRDRRHRRDPDLPPGQAHRGRKDQATNRRPPRPAPGPSPPGLIKLSPKDDAHALFFEDLQEQVEQRDFAFSGGHTLLQPCLGLG